MHSKRDATGELILAARRAVFRRAAARSALLALAAFLAACSSVPGETLSSGSQQREVRDRVLALARSADPQCSQPRITTTEVIDVQSDARPAEELWVVEQCGRRVNYLVSFSPRRGGGFTVRADR